MARTTDATARAQRLIPLAAVGALASATAFAFGRVFLGRAPTWKLIAAALMSVGIAALTERRGMLVATLASAAGLLLALTWLVFPQTAWYGLPTMRTLRAIGRSLEYVGRQARLQVAPTPPFPPLMLASMTAAWTAAFASHALAIRAGSPLLAVLPPIALVGFADIVLVDGVRPIYAVVFLLAALAVVFADGLRRIRQWGPVWSGPFRERALTSATGRGVRRVVLVAIGCAVLAPGLLPGFRSQALVDFSAPGDEGVRIDPFVSIQASLNRDSPVELFQVTSEGGAAYWRLFSLDRFDGSTWSSSHPDLSDAPEYDTPARLPVTYPPGAPALPQRVRILTDLGDRWVPMAYPAEALTLQDDGVRYDADLGQAQAPDPLEAGYEYGVTSRVLAPSPEQLDAVTFQAPAVYGRYTFLAGDVSSQVRQLAEDWTADQTTAYRKVLAIQRRFLDGSFVYDADIAPNSDADALLTFLTESKRGFCQQFSTAMAVLVRELGYPARVAVGFRPGTQRGDTFTVGTQDAHSWVEVFFPGYGWLAFEPTPGRTNPIATAADTYLNPSAPTSDGQETGGSQTNEGGAGGGTATCTGANGQPLPQQLCNADPRLRGRPDRGGGGGPLPAFGETGADGSGYDIPYGLLLTILLIGAVVLAVVVPIAKAAWRYAMLHRHREPRELVLAVYRVFDGEAADLGLGRHEGETLVEYGDRIATQVSFSDGHLATLTRAAMRAAYSAEPPEREDALGAARSARTAIRDMRRSAGVVRRITGIYRPGL